MNHKTDIVIIGAGPAGLFAAFQAGMLGMETHIIDALDFVGGQCAALYPQKAIYDIPAYPKIEAKELIDNLEAQAKQFNPIYHLSTKAENIERQDDGSFNISTTKGDIINAKAIVIAAGCGAFIPNRPPLDNIEDFEGKSIFYAIKDKYQFAGKRVVIAGGGDSAVDWALELHSVAKQVSIIHRRDKFRCTADSHSKLMKLSEEGEINIITPYHLHGVEGNDGVLERVIIKDLDENTKEINADILLPFYGLQTELGGIASWGLDIQNKHISVQNPSMRTNVDGIYAIGDVATYQHKLKLILVGFAEAANAMHDAYSIVKDGEKVKFMHSTSRHVG